jgi:hypothetical protein
MTASQWVHCMHDMYFLYIRVTLQFPSVLLHTCKNIINISKQAFIIEHFVICMLKVTVGDHILKWKRSILNSENYHKERIWNYGWWKVSRNWSMFTQHADNCAWERITTNNTSMTMATDKMLWSLKKSQRSEKKENATLGDNGWFCYIRNLYVYFAVSCWNYFSKTVLWPLWPGPWWTVKDLEGSNQGLPEVLFQHLPERTTENHKKSKCEQLMFQPTFKLSTSCMSVTITRTSSDLQCITDLFQ